VVSMVGSCFVNLLTRVSNPDEQIIHPRLNFVNDVYFAYPTSKAPDVLHYPANVLVCNE